MSERAFRFWQRWLLYASVFFCAFGVAVALFPDAFFLAPWTAAVAEVFYEGTEPAQAAAFRAFVLRLVAMAREEWEPAAKVLEAV